MEFKFKQCKMEDVKELLKGYINNLASPIDSFLEEHIIQSSFYMIIEDIKAVGYFAIHDNKLLTQFYVGFEYLKHSQEIFKHMLSEFPIERAFVPTCDELLLSLVIDQDVTVEKQAYFFEENKQAYIEDKVYQKGIFRIASREDIEAIAQMSGDFFDKLGERIDRNEIFVFEEGEVLLGAGIIERGEILKGYTSIGMITNEQYRRRGIGRTIIIKLKQWCHENNQIPISGCWYYNHNSKRTLESAGMVTKTRLLNIKLNSQEE